MNIADILSYISAFSVLVPIAGYFIFKSNYRVAGILFIVLLLSLASDIGNELFVKAGGRGYVILNSYYTIQFLLLNYMYYRLLKNKTWVYLVLILYTGFTTLNTLFIQSFITEFQSWSRILESVTLVSYAGLCYNQMLKYAVKDDRFNELVLWINMGVLFYFGLNLYMFGISNYTFSRLLPDEAKILWEFHNFINTVKNVLFAVGFYYAGRKKEPYAKI